MRIGIIGAGRVGQSHAQAIAARPDLTFAGFADPNLELAQARAAEFGGQGFADYLDLLATAPDAVVVGVPHCLHEEVATAAFAAGCHVLLEKPMACTVAECDRLLRARDAAGRQLMVGYTHHFMPNVRRARQLIADGFLGELVMGLDFMAYGQVEPEAERKIKWLLRREQSGGGTVMNMGSHSLARIMHLTGQPVVAVHAGCGNARPDLTHIDVELHTLALLHLAGGAVVTLWQDAYGQRNEDRLELAGTQGALVLGGHGSQLTLHRDGQAESVDLSGEPGGWAGEWEEFVASIREGRPPLVSGEFGRQVVATAAAIYSSAAGGGVVDVAPDWP